MFNIFKEPYTISTKFLSHAFLRQTKRNKNKIYVFGYFKCYDFVLFFSRRNKTKKKLKSEFFFWVDSLPQLKANNVNHKENKHKREGKR